MPCRKATGAGRIAQGRIHRVHWRDPIVPQPDTICSIDSGRNGEARALFHLVARPARLQTPACVATRDAWCPATATPALHKTNASLTNI